ncbi:multidrug transporter [Longimycelium tulufanense]|uniref:Multidrug transporter n=1 Tax=Longimycelium tulufanense TaxID=907463 RepID=A0A8J3C976_9PSEU|nr:DMT family transporter [Longimycelium tulufanense]GGM58778.1 multidrug transporter [Longimycelium tulufanense]
MTRPGSLLRFATLALLWGSSFLWIKLALAAFSPVQITLGRVALGALVLVAMCARKGQRPGWGRDVWLHLAVVALVANTVPFVLFGYGEQTVDSGLAGVLNATTPLWTLLFALLAKQERRMTLMRLAGLLLGFAGIMVIFAPWHAEGLLSWGALACLAASASYGVGFVYLSRHLSGRGLPPTATAAGQMIGATVLTTMAVPVAGLQPVHLDWLAIASVVVLGTLGTGFAFALNHQLIADEGPTNAATVTYVMPIVSVLLGTVVLGEVLSQRVLAGMAVVLVGVALTRRTPRNQPVPVPPEPARATQPAACAGD